MVIVIIAALAAALFNATSTVMQRHVSGQLQAGEMFRTSVIKAVARNKWWFVGLGLQVCGFFAQATALKFGPLFVVAPLITSGLIFMLLIMHFVLKARMGWQGWVGMIAVAVGLSSLLLFAQPQGGQVPRHFTVWVLLFAVIGSVVVGGAVVMRMIRSDRLRAAVGGVVAGSHFGLVAAVSKLVVLELTHGVWHEFVNWPLYALIVVGTTSMLSMQSMFGAGPVTYSQPALEITEALQGALIGVAVFGESVQHTNAALALESAAALVIAVGVVLLTRIERDPIRA